MYEGALGFVVSGCSGGAGAELGAAAVRHPDAGLVVAPGPSEQTGRGARRSQQHDAFRRVGRALRAFTWFGCARHRRDIALRRGGVLTSRRVVLRVLCCRRRREKDKKKERRQVWNDRRAHWQGLEHGRCHARAERGSRDKSLTANRPCAASSGVVLAAPPLSRRTYGSNRSRIRSARLSACVDVVLLRGDIPRRSSGARAARRLRLPV